jgi:hypothetical protein
MITPAALAAAMSGDMENFIAASTAGGIEAQEKRGQMEQAQKQTLPLDLRGREHFEALGFVFGSPVEEIFQETTFPEGWKKVPTDHSMWSDLVDDKGRKRGGIFYKAAFYDRSAHASLSPRFHVSKDYESKEPTDTVMVVDACGIVDRKIEGLPKPDWSGDREKAREASGKSEAASDELTAWLDAEYPEWRSPVAYWDISNASVEAREK